MHTDSSTRRKKKRKKKKRKRKKEEKEKKKKKRNQEEKEKRKKEEKRRRKEMRAKLPFCFLCHCIVRQQKTAPASNSNGVDSQWQLPPPLPPLHPSFPGYRHEQRALSTGKLKRSGQVVSFTLFPLLVPFLWTSAPLRGFCECVSWHYRMRCRQIKAKKKRPHRAPFFSSLRRLLSGLARLKHTPLTLSDNSTSFHIWSLAPHSTLNY